MSAEAPPSSDKKPEGSSEEPDPWSFDTFSCFDDPRLCLFTFCVPCYTIGRNAEAFGEDGLITGWCLINYLKQYFDRLLNNKVVVGK